MTQDCFAELIGASLDTVKSWERRRKPNRISSGFQNRILLETGAEFHNGSLRASWRFLNKFANKPYTKEHFDYWRKSVVQTDKARVVDLIEQGKAAIELLLKSALERRGQPLRAVWQAFEDWFAQTSKDFNLGREIERLAPEGAKGPFLGVRGRCIWLLPPLPATNTRNNVVRRRR